MSDLEPASMSHLVRPPELELEAGPEQPAEEDSIRNDPSLWSPGKSRSPSNEEVSTALQDALSDMFGNMSDTSSLPDDDGSAVPYVRFLDHFIESGETGYTPREQRSSRHRTRSFRRSDSFERPGSFERRTRITSATSASKGSPDASPAQGSTPIKASASVVASVDASRRASSSDRQQITPPPGSPPLKSWVNPSSRSALPPPSTLPPPLPLMATVYSEPTLVDAAATTKQTRRWWPLPRKAALTAKAIGSVQAVPTENTTPRVDSGRTWSFVSTSDAPLIPPEEAAQLLTLEC